MSPPGPPPARRNSVTTGKVGIRGKLRTGGVGHALRATASTFTLKSRNAYALSDFGGYASTIYSPAPVAGLVYQPMQNLSLYANYIESLARGPVAGGTAVNAGDVFSPYF